MSPFASFIRNPRGVSYDGVDSDEEILYILRRSNLTNFPWMVSVGILGVLPFFVDPILHAANISDIPLISVGFLGSATLFWYLFVFGYFLQNVLNWYFNVLIISNKKIIDMDFHGVTYKNISETTLTSVEDVTSNISGPIGTIFNIGDIYIQTAAEKREFEFKNMTDPSKIRDIIADLVASKKHHGNN